VPAWRQALEMPQVSPPYADRVQRGPADVDIRV
jgi:hypothetical protein